MRLGANLYRFLRISCLGFVLASTGCESVHDSPMPDVKASMAPAVIARGEYLVYGPAGCARCHTDRAQQSRLQQGELLPLKGGRHWATAVADVYAANITSDRLTGVGAWSDQEIARVIRYGVDKQGDVIFPMMEYADISDDDLQAIVSYLRSTEPVSHVVPDNQWHFWGGLIKPFVLKSQQNEQPIQKSRTRDTSEQYGEYLANELSHCVACHTPRSQRTGRFIGPALSGGTRFPDEHNAAQVIVPPNLTPEPSTGRIAHWSEQQFVQRMKAGTNIRGTHMPWGAFMRTDENDLIAIYRYLNSVPPVKNDTGLSVQKAE